MGSHRIEASRLVRVHHASQLQLVSLSLGRHNRALPLLLGYHLFAGPESFTLFPRILSSKIRSIYSFSLAYDLEPLHVDAFLCGLQIFVLLVFFILNDDVLLSDLILSRHEGKLFFEETRFDLILVIEAKVVLLSVRFDLLVQQFVDFHGPVGGVNDPLLAASVTGRDLRREAVLLDECLGQL